MKRLLAIIAIFEAFSLSFFMLNLWYFAFINGESVSIQINAFGEMWGEYLLWLILTPVLVLGLHYTLEEFRSHEKDY
ncbi:hypothetical protein ACFQGE_12105 [Halomicroarcula sp. GCM10025817]|uniref:hypothetical protein n=1 Tax=Haloarcula TaxID=2237 RepID=UPI0023E84E3B|nr:hypothetical protein [Halomicroarcula sp. SYNS111]